MAVALRHDKELGDAIRDVNLREKDFRKHKICYKNYASVVSNEAEKTSTSPSHPTDDWLLARKTIDETVLQQQKCLSLDTLMELKGIRTKNHHIRRNMKSWVQRNYGNYIVFLTAEVNKGQIIMSKQSLVAVERGEKVVTETFPLSDDTSLKHAANVLRQIIDDYISQADDLPWPPTVESLKTRLASTPKLLLHFFKVLLTESHHTISESISLLAESFVQDLLFAITKGKFLTLKHTCIGLGLHNMTGKKLPIVILSHFGQSITYHAVIETEKLKQHMLSLQNILQTKVCHYLFNQSFHFPKFQSYFGGITLTILLIILPEAVLFITLLALHIKRR